MKYEYKDTFIKKCSSANGIGECERSRESVKCIDNVCTKVNNPKNKKEILQEHFKQNGSGSELQLKHPCPYCNKRKHMSSLIKHLYTHEHLPKTQMGGCGACMIGGSGSGSGSGDTICPFCKKSVSMHSLIKHIHSHKGHTAKELVGGCSVCMMGGQNGGGGKIINEAKQILMHNLKNKYRCPICNRYKYLDDMETHKKKYHSNVLRNIRNRVLAPNEYKVGRFTLSKQSGSGKKQFYGKKSSVMVKVPTNVKNTAIYAYKLRKLGFKGGQETGWKRAKQLSTKETIPLEDLRYMRAWFARHVFTSYPTYRKWQKAGRPKDNFWHNKHGIISWIIWGSDSAFRWVNSTKNINLLNKHFPGKNYKKINIPKIKS